MAELNAVVQFIVKTQRGRGYDGMAAGSGWFFDHDGEKVIITNAHVVNNCSAVFIRLPAAHTTNIQVYPVGISTDLDLAVCKLDDEGMNKVLGILRSKYDIEEIPSLEMADSDSVHLSSFKNMAAPRVIARGYPHGTEYQQFTDGRVSGIKHANEQEYIVTTATIEPGNSGGPCVNEQGQVIGINSMKMTNATETNIIIPSNRVKRVVSYLLDNTINTKIIQDLLSQQAVMNMISMHFAKGQVSRLEQDGLKIDEVKVNNLWEKHNLGGFKKDASGKISRVSLADWYTKHVLHNEQSYALFKKVMEHLHNGSPEEIVKMRKEGFQSFCKKETQPTAPVSVDKDLLKQTPPRLLHMPRLGFRTNNANEAALEHYKQEHGVIIRDVVKGSIFEKHGVKKYDLVTHINNQKIDNFGEVWNEKLNVSLPFKDIIHRTEFGKSVSLTMVDQHGGKKDIEFEYCFLKEDEKPNIRVLETLQDSVHAREVKKLPNGLVVKTLRLSDVYQMNLREYMQEHRQNDYKLVVCEILPGSDAFHTMNFRVGTVLGKIDGTEVANTWVKACQQLTDAFTQDHTFAIESDKGRIMFAQGVSPQPVANKVGSKEAPFESCLLGDNSPR